MTPRTLSLLMLAIAASSVPASATTITLTAPSSLAAGSSFDIVVRIANVFSAHPGDALAAFGFNVASDPAFVSFTGATTGGLFDDFSGVFGGSPEVAGLASSGFLAAGDFTEPLTLATLHFLALAPGSTSIGITTDLTDLNQGLFYATAGADALNAARGVTIGAGTPEPATFLLGGLALGSMLLYRQRARR